MTPSRRWPPAPAGVSTASCALDDEQAWALANPALDDFLHRDALRATLPPKMRENAFRRYRLGQVGHPRRRLAARRRLGALRRPGAGDRGRRRLLSHDGSAALARHVAKAVLREDSRGARLAQAHKDSKRRIDAAVAAVMAHDRAAILAGDRGPSIYL
jgi:hypothetical protein